jgi:hypothetical protein
VKKARGLLTADTSVTLPSIAEPIDHDVTCVISDASGTVVSRCTVTWRLSPPGERPASRAAAAPAAAGAR